MKKQEFDTLVQRMLKANEWNYAGFLAQYLPLVELFDKARAPVADAAWFLFSVHQSLPAWLKEASADSIKYTARAGGEAAFKMGLVHFSVPMFVVRCGEFALVDTRDAQYPDRQATADAAEFLVTQVGIGRYWLKKVGAQQIREDAKELEAMLKARQVEVSITVSRLLEDGNGGYIDLKFYKGDVKVGEVTILGKTSAPYVRRLTLSGDYDMVRCESSPSAIYRIDRVKS